MKFSFLKNTINENWKYSQIGNIWRFFISGDEFISGETRDIENRKAYFFTLDIKTGKPFLKNYVYEKEEYWTSIEFAYKNILFIHKFEHPELPHHKGITAIDIISGKIIWENDEMQYFFINDNILYTIKQLLESFEIYMLDSVSGKNLGKIENEKINEIYAMRDDLTDYENPEKYLYTINFERNENETSISDIILNETKARKYYGNPEYIIYDDILIFNVYFQKELDFKDITKLNLLNKIFIYNINTQSKLYEQVINDNCNFNVPDSFFIYGKYLFMVVEKKEIVCFDLQNINGKIK
jgi:uncharacterized protein (UPF0248 family)